jgi:hypothetical protein
MLVLKLSTTPPKLYPYRESVEHSPPKSSGGTFHSTLKIRIFFETPPEGVCDLLVKDWG